MERLFFVPNAVLIPLLYGMGLLAPMVVGAGTAWSVAACISALTLGCALSLATTSASAAIATGGATDPLGLILLLLITLLGWVITRFSRRYLAGEPRQGYYLVALFLVLASTSTVVISKNLGVLVLAWTSTSIGVQLLLTFYGDRRAALIAAHKKFLASRAGDVLLLLALICLWTEVGSLSIEDISSYLSHSGMRSLRIDMAAGFIAAALLMKSAQLPVHGWLMQVMEAPTPVSALLHAGVVNLGGVVAIRLAPLFQGVPFAQGLLVVFGTVTSVLAGIVMMTRISIKVRLAWSTCAQMGFMLIECGLGLYALALLHIVAHSLYKAYSFLSAGDTVTRSRQRRMHLGDLVQQERSYLGAKIAALPLAGAGVLLSSMFWQRVFPEEELTLASVCIIAIAVAPLFWALIEGKGASARTTLVRALTITQLSFFWHGLFASALNLPVAPIPGLLSAFVGISFLGLYATQCWLITFPKGRFAQRLYPWAYGGFFIDERFTRATFRLWPLRLPEAASTATEIPSTCHALTGEQA